MPASLPSGTPPPSRLSAFFAFFSRHSLVLPVLVLGVFLFCVYGTYRQRYVWGVDSFGYLELGKLFSEGRATLPATLPTLQQRALVPMGFVFTGTNQALPTYPPGFPLLLAVGHRLRAPMFVTPFLGAVSSVLLFGLLRRRVPTIIAFLLSLAWAFMPLAVSGSTMLMSDIAAATFLLGAVAAFRSGRVAATAWLLGFSFAVRPTNVLFLLPFALLLRPDRASLRLVLHLIVPCGLYALYNYLMYGAPWRTGYGDVSDALQTEIFSEHFWFYVSVTPALLGPVIAILATLGVYRWNREKAFLIAWPLVFMLFYATWAAGGADRWWWARFILPAYPAFYLLAGEGSAHVLDWLSRIRAPHLRRVAHAILGLVLLTVPIYGVRYARANGGGVWVRDVGAPNYLAVQRVSALVPAGSLVGSVELTSSFILYSSVVPFVSVYEDSPDLVAKALAGGRRVFLLVEPQWSNDPTIVRTMSHFNTREIARYDFLWQGLPLYELTAK